MKPKRLIGVIVILAISAGCLDTQARLAAPAWLMIFYAACSAVVASDVALGKGPAKCL